MPKGRIKKLGVVGVSIGSVLAWVGQEIYQLKQESVANQTEIQNLKDTVESHRQSQQELIKLHLVLK